MHFNSKVLRYVDDNFWLAFDRWGEAQLVSHVRNTGSREVPGTDAAARRDMPASVPQLIRSSLKVISQARNRNHRQPNYRLYVAAGCRVPTLMQTQRVAACDAFTRRAECALVHSRTFHVTGNSFLGGCDQRTDRLFIPRFWQTRESERPKPRLIGHNN